MAHRKQSPSREPADEKARRKEDRGKTLKQALDTSSLLGRSIEVLAANALPFLSIALVVQSPQVILVAAGRGIFGEAQGEASFLAILGLLLPLLALTQVQAGLIAPGVARFHQGEAVKLRHCLPRSGGMALAILLAAAMVALAAAGGFLFFLLPGWVVLTGFFVALPAVTVGELPPVAALGLSWRLTTRNWISLFALVFMFTVLERLLSLAFAWLGAPPVVSALIAVPVSALQAVTAGVAYLRFRSDEPTAEPPGPHPEAGPGS